MQFEYGDETDKNLVNVLFHEFVMCEAAFEKFAFFAGANIMGNRDSNIKLNSYNAYSEFLSKLYEFYVGCFKREFLNTGRIEHQKLDALFTAEAEKLMRNRRVAIEKGYAPDWENDISYYQESVPTDFGQDFRSVRNNTSHADYRRADGDRPRLMDFYRKYHKFVYLLFASASFAWSGKTHTKHELAHVEDFDFSSGRN